MIGLVPAIPSDWNNGEACGLKARGGYTFDFAWENRKIKTITVSAIKKSDIMKKHAKLNLLMII